VVKGLGSLHEVICSNINATVISEEKKEVICLLIISMYSSEWLSNSFLLGEVGWGLGFKNLLSCESYATLLRMVKKVEN